jgi:hypothetical protein
MLPGGSFNSPQLLSLSLPRPTTLARTRATRARSEGGTSVEWGRGRVLRRGSKDEAPQVSVARCKCRDAATQEGRGVGEV